MAMRIKRILSGDFTRTTTPSTTDKGLVDGQLGYKDGDGTTSNQKSLVMYVDESRHEWPADLPSLDSYVLRTGNQTINGVKTFQEAPRIPTQTGPVTIATEMSKTIPTSIYSLYSTCGGFADYFISQHVASTEAATLNLALGSTGATLRVVKTAALTTASLLLVNTNPTGGTNLSGVGWTSAQTYTGGVEGRAGNVVSIAPGANAQIDTDVGYASVSDTNGVVKTDAFFCEYRVFVHNLGGYVRTTIHARVRIF